MKSAKLILSTLLVVASAGAMAQETSMDAARAQRMEAAMQGFLAANPDMDRVSPAASTPMAAMRKGHHPDGAKKHHSAKAGHGHKGTQPMADGAAPMAGSMSGGPKGDKP
jgi:hypothetical protein